MVADRTILFVIVAPLALAGAACNLASDESVAAPAQATVVPNSTVVSSGNAVNDALEAVQDAPDSEYELAPGGRRIHKSCLHRIPDGGHLDHAKGHILSEDGTVVEQFETCRYKQHVAHIASSAGQSIEGAPAPLPDTQLYQEWSGAAANRNAVCLAMDIGGLYCKPWFDSFYGSVQVPDNPTDRGQTIFLWSGLMATTNLPAGAAVFPLLQPVLQWGPSAAGGGHYWAFGSWYFDASGTAFHTNLTSINPGDWYVMNTFISDNLDNTCNSTGSNCHWRVAGRRYSDGAFQSLDLTSARIPGTFDAVYRAVLEAYDSSRSSTPACNIYPINGGTTFANTQAFQPFLNATDYRHLSQNWQAVTHNVMPYCYGQTIGNQTDTVLYFYQ